MASVEKDGQGYRVRFIDHNKERKTIRLSGINKANATTVAHHVQQLVNWRKSGLNLDSQTAEWIAKKVGQELHDKLANAGLIERRSSSQLSEFMAEIIADAKTTDGRPAAANTLRKWRQAEKVLNEFFGNRNLRDISHDDAAKFRRWLDAKTLGENSKRVHIAVAKMFLNSAKRRKLVDENPFEFQKASLVLDRSRDFFLTRANAMKIIDACPDTQWRLIFSLWRFAAIRKMEIFQLRWENVLWDQGKMLVTIPKTRHHAGKESRFVPIGDILPWLEKAFDEAPEGSERIITRFTESNVNLAKPFEKIIEAAGLTVWPKLIQNLRASCETEWLDAGNPAHVVARWVGHSVRVQNDNYAQVDDHHFNQFNERAKANQIQASIEAETHGGGAQAGAQGVQTDPKRPTSKKARPPKAQCFSGVCVPVSSSTKLPTTPDRSRTCGLRFRKAPLYPAELRGRCGEYIQFLLKCPPEIYVICECPHFRAVSRNCRAL
jgi:integrase